MNGAEKITHLVEICEGGNARRFADRCGIPTASLSRARHGKAPAEAYFPRILKAYPSVRREWLYNNIGEPTSELAEKAVLLTEIQALRKEVAELYAIVKKLAGK